MNLNPFDLTGPRFLFFYAVLLAITTAVIWIARRMMEEGSDEEADAACRKVAKDPYEAAFLRGGRNEVVRVAVVSLIERNFLEASGSKLKLSNPEVADHAPCNLDKAILLAVAANREPQSLFSDSLVQREADLIGEPLRQLRLLPDAKAKTARAVLLVIGVLFLWTIAGIKIAVALSRQRSNIGILLVMAAILPILFMCLTTMRLRTGLGEKAYKRLQALFQRLYDRRTKLKDNTTSSELAYLAAIFGVAALPAAMTEVLTPLKLRPGSSLGSGGCGGGSSCGGGGGCGGGGCGGGCGGCG